MRKLSTALTIGLLALGSASAFAEQSCETVKMADPGWSDIAATNAITGFLLDGMGYKAKVDTLAVPITFGGLKDGQVDVFLGNWMPAQQASTTSSSPPVTSRNWRRISTAPSSPWPSRIMCGMPVCMTLPT